MLVLLLSGFRMLDRNCDLKHERVMSGKRAAGLALGAARCRSISDYVVVDIVFVCPGDRRESDARVQLSNSGLIQRLHHVLLSIPGSRAR